jgi:dimethylglycine dehydrogenase
MGCGLAYHLAHEGWTDVVLLEKAELTIRLDLARGGADHPFDLVLRLGKCVDYNIGLYSGKLEAETGSPSPGMAAGRSGWPIPRTRWTGCATR